MPYTAQKEGSNVVVRGPTGKVMGKHPSMDHAKKQIAAMLADEAKAKRSTKKGPPSSEEGEPVG